MPLMKRFDFLLTAESVFFISFSLACYNTEKKNEEIIYSQNHFINVLVLSFSLKV